MSNYSDNFTIKELACPCCQVVKLQEGFIYDLEELRDYCRFPVIVSSCCRCGPHNIEVGGHERSLHQIDNTFHECGTCAVDILSSRNSHYAYKLIEGLVKFEWSIRIYDKHIHADKRTKYTETKLQPKFKAGC